MRNCRFSSLPVAYFIETTHIQAARMATLRAMTDPNGEHLFVDFVETVTRQKFGHGGLFVAPSGIGGAGGQIVEGAEPLIVSSVSRLRPDAMVERLDHYVARDLHPALR